MVFYDKQMISASEEAEVFVAWILTCHAVRFIYPRAAVAGHSQLAHVAALFHDTALLNPPDLDFIAEIFATP